MKRADKNTGWLMLRAYTSSEWDSCDFVIVKTDNDWLATIKNRMLLLEPPKTDSMFYALTYWEYPEGFYMNSELMDECLPQGHDWGFVETTPEELATLNVPENSLDCFTLQITRGGSLQFKAYGKHSGEEFYSESLHFGQLLETIEKN